MIRTTAALLAVALIGGCAASGELENPFSEDQMQPQRAQRAAFAASAQYPEQQSERNAPIAAMVNQENNTLRIVNYSDQPVRSAQVWVNGSFINRVENIPAHSSVRLSFQNFYNRSGRSLAQVNAAVNKVELQSQDQFIHLLGPVAD